VNQSVLFGKDLSVLTFAEQLANLSSGDITFATLPPAARKRPRGGPVRWRLGGPGPAANRTGGGLADVDSRSVVGVGFGAAEDFPGGGGDLADAEEQEPEQVADGVAFGPFEVHVGVDLVGVA
jgi:hypothetical protein